MCIRLMGGDLAPIWGGWKKIRGPTFRMTFLQGKNVA